MGYLMPLIVLSVFIGLVAVHAHHTQAMTPSVQAEQSELDGRHFLAYRNAVLSFIQRNPGFTGTVAANALEGQFTAEFLNTVGNYITATSSGKGRIITCYATLSPGALYAARIASDNDASLGMSLGTHWVSIASAVGHSEPLAVSIPHGKVVSVIQIGV